MTSRCLCLRCTWPYLAQCNCNSSTWRKLSRERCAVHCAPARDWKPAEEVPWEADPSFLLLGSLEKRLWNQYDMHLNRIRQQPLNPAGFTRRGYSGSNRAVGNGAGWRFYVEQYWCWTRVPGGAYLPNRRTLSLWPRPKVGGLAGIERWLSLGSWDFRPS